MLKLFEFCKKYNVRVSVEYMPVNDCAVYRFYDPETNKGLSMEISMFELRHLNEEQAENYIYDKAIRDLKLDEDPFGRRLAFIMDEIEPDEAYVICKCCKGSGYIQIAPGIRCVDKCHICDGKGKIRIK